MFEGGRGKSRHQSITGGKRGGVDCNQKKIQQRHRQGGSLILFAGWPNIALVLVGVLLIKREKVEIR